MKMDAKYQRQTPHVVIVGGGFGGLYCARALRRAPVRITLIDRRNFHLFQPLLYEVATATMSPADITATLRSVLRRQKNLEVCMGEVVDVDVENRRVVLGDGGELTYDHLVVATGLTNHYFGHPEWEQLAPGLKSIEDAIEIRRRFLHAFEAAEWEEDPEARRRLLTFTIVGAGSTGVELAGAMVEVARQVLPRDFRRIDTSIARILLLEGADRVLPGYPPALSEKAEKQLRKLGVEVRTGARVTRIEPDCIWLGEERIETNNVFWAAGVAGSPLARRLGAELDTSGRVMVEPDCSIPDHPEVFVIGDLAHFEKAGRVITGVAPAAIQMAKFVAKAIRNDLAGKPRDVFKYFDKGYLATIGKSAAVAETAGVRMSGFPAWSAWVFVHIVYLIGFRNRLAALVQWIVSWLFAERGVRLITGSWDVQLEQPHNAAGGPEAQAPANPADAAPGGPRRRKAARNRERSAAAAGS